MIKLSVLYGHPKDAAAFERYYFDVHTPIALKVKGVRRFETAKVQSAAGGGPAPYHRTADLYFDDTDALNRALGSPEGRAAAADLVNFATGGVTLMVCDVQDLLSR